jgi:DNA-binding CsgD family transcriptional regulator
MKRYLKAFFLLGLVFEPLFVAETFLNYGNIDASFLRPLTAVHLYYFLWNVASLGIAARQLMLAPQGGAVGEIPEGFVERYRITPREREVIALLIQGWALKEIGQKLGISFQTVKNHTYNIYQKTDVASKVHLINLLRKR